MLLIRFFFNVGKDRLGPPIPGVVIVAVGLSSKFSDKRLELHRNNYRSFDDEEIAIEDFPIQREFYNKRGNQGRNLIRDQRTGNRIAFNRADFCRDVRI